ncbi:MAG: hypothetical protein U0269_04830 [Polyangiales bacterium]
MTQPPSSASSLPSNAAIARATAMLALCVGVSLVGATADARRAPPPGWQLEPGRSLGAVTMGMSRAELSRIGRLTVGSLGPNVVTSGAWTFFLDARGNVRLARRRLGLTPGVVISGRRVAPSMPLTMIERLRIPGCSSIQQRPGGNTITCRSRWGWAHFTQGAATAGHVEVDISRDR